LTAVDWGYLVAYTAMWVAWRTGHVAGDELWPIVASGSILCGALLRRWWAPLLALIPVVLSIGWEMDDGPAFIAVLVLWAPLFALALGIGVVVGRALLGVSRRFQQPDSDTSP